MTLEEKIARVIDPRVFLDDPAEEHRACSPHQVEVVRRKAILKARAILSLLPNTGEREKALEEAAINDLKSRLDTRLNNWLCEMKPDHDDSIVGFNEAWDIVNKVFKDTRALKSTPKPVGEDVVSALAGMLDIFSGYCCPQVDAAITAMQRIGRDRWSMAYQMKASVFEFDDGETNVKPDETLSKIENTTDGFIVSYWSGRFSKIFPTLEEAVEAHKDNFCRN